MRRGTAKFRGAQGVRLLASLLLWTGGTSALITVISFVSEMDL